MDSDDFIHLLKKDLLAARKTQDYVVMHVLQSLLTRISNAEAVQISTPTNRNMIGVGSTEMIRKKLTHQDLRNIVKQELKEIDEALESIKAYPDHPYAGELKRRIGVLERYL